VKTIQILSPGTTMALMSVRILVADDDSTIRRLVRRLLEGHAEWQVCGEAVDGLDAVSKVTQYAPDVAILDLGMPRMNGFQAAREISKIKPGVLMLLISVQQVSKEMVQAARDAGFLGAVTKVRGSEVVKGVEAALKGEPFYVGTESLTTR
jgi:DNA-binding NarL/FixJ family response regulator